MDSTGSVARDGSGAGPGDTPPEGAVVSADIDSSWWVDDARTRRADDALGRGPFAGRVVDILHVVAGNPSSTVLGLVGAWGSGKSTTIELIVDQLDDVWCHVPVNPWALSSADAVVHELLASIAQAFPKKARDRVKGALHAYSNAAAPLLAALPVVGGAAGAAASAAAALSSDEQTLEKRAQAVTALLTELKQPVLVIVDDVDRLQPEELLALFKAVRVLGRLPYVHYLLAYDQQTVLDVLAATPVAADRHDRALAFLEKIVTLRLDQPPTRREQAAGLLRTGLAAALAASHVVLSEDQAARLTYETEALFVRQLTEPRTILRLHSQLRVYLPLIGPTEVDVVDLTVLTFLRISYPKLYAALSVDQQLLTAGPLGDEDGSDLAEWTSSERLDEFDVPRADQRRIVEALRRLFPRLRQEHDITVLLEEQAGRSGRRAHSADHVARYFALAPIAEDFADADLLDTLERWCAGQPGRPAIEQALRPDRSDKQACLMAARLLRRADSYQERFSPQQARTLLATVISLLPLPGLPAGGESPEAAATTWMAQLFAKAGGADFSTLEHVEPVAVLVPIVRAMTLAADEQRLQRRHHGDPVESDEEDRWLRAALDTAEELAWTAFLGNVAQGNAAPDEPAGTLLGWLANRWGEDLVRQRLVSEVLSGLDVWDVAARMVDVGTDVATGRRSLIGFDTRTASRRLGPVLLPRDTARARRPSGPDADPASNPPYLEAPALDPPGDERNVDDHDHDHDDDAGDEAGDVAGAALAEDDVSWRNRRRYARRYLLDDLRNGPGMGHLANIRPRADAGPLMNFNPDLLDAPGAEIPDLSVRVTVVVPAAAGVPQHNPAPGPEGAAREEIVSDLLERSPLTRWLRAAAPTWSAQLEDWAWRPGNARMRTQAGTSLRADTPGAGWRTQTPVLAGVQVLTGLAHDHDGNVLPALVLSTSVGIWLTELDAHRRPADRRYDQVPLPAALTLKELYQLLSAVCASIETALQARQDLLQTQPRKPRSDAADGMAGPAMIVRVEVSAGEGLQRVVELARFQQVPSENRTRVDLSVDVTVIKAGNVETCFPHPRDIAARTISEWLLQAGVREYEAELAELVLLPDRDDAGDIAPAH